MRPNPNNLLRFALLGEPLIITKELRRPLPRTSFVWVGAHSYPRGSLRSQAFRFGRLSRLRLAQFLRQGRASIHPARVRFAPLAFRAFAPRASDFALRTIPPLYTIGSLTHMRQKARTSPMLTQRPVGPPRARRPPRLPNPLGTPRPVQIKHHRLELERRYIAKRSAPPLSESKKFGKAGTSTIFRRRISTR